MVHVTSFFDDKTPKVLANLLAEAKEVNPLLKISFDPGHYWVQNLSDDIRRILKLTDYLFLNLDEFESLGNSVSGTLPKKVATYIFDLCSTTTLLIVLKLPAATQLFSLLDGKQILPLKYDHTPLAHDSIEDSTGAGDVFAGGFLTALLLPGLELHHGVKLGLSLVKTKLRSSGLTNFYKFAEIYTSVVDEILKTAEIQDETIAAIRKKFKVEAALILIVPYVSLAAFMVGTARQISIYWGLYILLFIALIGCALWCISIVGSKTPNIQNWKWFVIFKKLQSRIFGILVVITLAEISSTIFWIITKSIP